MPSTPFSFPRATVLIPTFNEAANIEACLRAVAAQDVGPSCLEVLVVDGHSTDGTADIAQRFMDSRGQNGSFAAWRVVLNDRRSRPANLNRGLQDATCPILCRVDARSRVPPHYVRTCCAILEERPEVAVVGGRQRAAGDGTTVGLGIARAVNNRWGMGGATYRRATLPGPADTVYLGAFRTDQVRAARGWDEQLAVNEDFDLNRRMSSHGLIWFDPALEVTYLPRPSLAALATQYWAFGRGKARYLRRTGDQPQPRQLGAAAAVPIATGAGLAGTLGRRSRRYTLALGAAVVATVELLGTDRPAGPPAAHLVSAAATVIIAEAWVAGLWAELLFPSGPPDPARQLTESGGFNLRRGHADTLL
jgi:succinoglycan biosynthesis protein ExoA